MEIEAGMKHSSLGILCIQLLIAVLVEQPIVSASASNVHMHGGRLKQGARQLALANETRRGSDTGSTPVRRAETALSGEVWYGVGDIWEKLEMEGVSWQARAEFGCVLYQDRIIVMGGVTTSKNVEMKDVWSSIDGKTWVKEQDAEWEARSSFASVVHDGALFVIGGRGVGQDNLLNDVWRSPPPDPTGNGPILAFHRVQEINRDVQNESTFTPRERSLALSLGEKIYLLGGCGVSCQTPYREVWESADSGITWDRTELNVPLPTFHSTFQLMGVTYGGSIYLVLGSTAAKLTRTSDPRSLEVREWSYEASSGYLSRLGVAVQHVDSLWVLGGGSNSGGASNGVVAASLNHGSAKLIWKEIPLSGRPDSRFEPRTGHGGVVLGQRMCVLGGR